LSVERSLVELNDHLAIHNRERFEEEGVFVVNMMSSPGAGKTRLLERTLDDLTNVLNIAVITGDLQTDNDAQRLWGRGAQVVPVTTGTMCHLEADSISRACEVIDLKPLDVLVIENVGNLVCPASFDLGEGCRAVLMSTTEGEDKPLKYPPMFKLADVVILTKTDLGEAAGFDREKAVANIRSVAPQARLFEVSAKSGEGLNHWYMFLLDSAPRHFAARLPASAV
jgi:hydrogenase nickel incorporation protein HypB